MTTKTVQKTRKGIRFYHPDHLGSTTVVTDLDGEVTQNVAYIPYGEVFVEQRNGTWNTPYLFNAKELDEETGLYYYGARYLDPTGTRWLSVDPLFEKYVGMSPYNYCAGNPVKLVDVDGMKFTDNAEEWVSRMEDEIKIEIAKIDNKKTQRKHDILKRGKLEAAQAEINKLRESDQIYDVRTYERRCSPLQTDSRGFVSYDQDNNQFVININTWRDASTEGSDIGSFAHELKHAYQFEIGRLSFVSTGSGITKTPGYLYDYIDEVEAHERGNLFNAVGHNPDRNTYGYLKKDKEYHIGIDNYIQFIQYKKRHGEDLLENNIYRYNK